MSIYIYLKGGGGQKKKLVGPGSIPLSIYLNQSRGRRGKGRAGVYLSKFISISISIYLEEGEQDKKREGVEHNIIYLSI